MWLFGKLTDGREKSACNRKLANSQKLNTSLLNKKWYKTEIKDFLELNENQYTTYTNLWDTIKAFLRGKFIAPDAYIKKNGVDAITS